MCRPLLFCAFSFLFSTLQAAFINWTNGAGTGLWGDGGNWSTGTVPGNADVAVFNNFSPTNCSVNTNVNVQGILVNTFYTGVITQQPGVSMVVGTGGFVQHGGTFQGGTAAFTINGGVFTQTNGVFNATSGSMSIGGTRTTSATLFGQSGGTFLHNNGTLVISPYSNVGPQLTYTLDVQPTASFHNVVINITNNWTRPVLATAAGDVVRAMNDLVHTDGYVVGEFAVQGNLRIGSNADGGTGLITVDGSGAQEYDVAAGAQRTCRVEVNKPTGTFGPSVGTTDFLVQGFSLLSGDFTAPAGSLNVGGTWGTSQTLFNHGGGTYAHNNGTLVINPYSNVGPTLTWTIDVLPTTALHNVTINANNNWTLPRVATAAGDVVRAMNDLVHTDGYVVGEFAVQGNLRIGSNADGGTGLITVDGSGAQEYDVAAGAQRTCRVEVNKPTGTFGPSVGTTDFLVQGFSLLSGDFTAPAGSLNVGGTWGTSQTLFNHGGGTYAHNNGTLVINPYSNVGPTLTWTIDVLPTTALHNVTINANNNWTLPRVATAAGDVVRAMNDLVHTDGYVVGEFAVQGNLRIGSNADGGTGLITVDGSGAQEYDVAAGAQRTCRVEVNKPTGTFGPSVGTTDFLVQGFGLLSGDFTAPAGSLNVGGTWGTSQTLFNHGGGTYAHNNGTLVINPYSNVGPTLTWTIDVLPTTALHNVTINANNNWTLPRVATAAGDVVRAMNDLVHTDGYVVGEFAVQGNLRIGSNADGGTGLITVDGSGAQEYDVAAGAQRTCRVEVNKPTGTFGPSVGTTDFLVQGFSLLSGDFTAPAGSLNVGGTWGTSQTLFNHGGGTYAHNNGTLVINPYSNVGPTLTWTIDVLPTTALHNVTINANNNWTLPRVATAAGDVVRAMNDLVHTDGYVVGEFAVQGNLRIGSNADGGTGLITVDGSGAQEYDVAAGAQRTCRVEVNKPTGTFGPSVGTTDFLVQGFSLLSGDFTAPAGSLNVGGTWGTSQTLFNHGGGTYAHNNGTLVINPYSNVGPTLTWTIDVLPTTALHNVTINANNNWTLPQGVIPAGDTLQVAGHLRLADGRMTVGVMEVHGNVSVLPAYDGGNAQLLFAGSGAQQFDLTGAIGNYNGDIKLAKNASVVDLLSDLLLDATNQDLFFVKGHLTTSATEMLIIGDNVNASGASDSSFVQGPVRKTGNDPFVFPVGAFGASYAPISISAPAAVGDAFTAEYFNSDPQTVPYDVALLGPGLHHVSRCEYWNLERTTGGSNVRVTLSWAPRSCGVTALPDMRVARWDGAQWVSHGNGATLGNVLIGTVQSHITITPTAFGPFTLGSSSPNNPLPIELIDFQAVPAGDRVELLWSTASEKDNDHFIIERSADGTDFEELLSTDAVGNSSTVVNYAAEDHVPLPGWSYYRLRQVDSDGTSTLSHAVVVHFGADEPDGFTVYPNPTMDGIIRLQQLGSTPLGTLRVFDAAGRAVVEQVGTTGSMHAVRSVDLGHLPNGTYRVQVECGANTITEQVVVAR